jgi:two-component system response regulator FixJ
MISQNRTLVVVDDDDAVRQSTSRLLERAGNRVHSFSRGDAFLEAGLPAETDAILLDLRMPVMGGIEVLRALAEKGEVPPVIVLTGHGDVPLAVEAMKLGAAEFLEKPYPPDQLVEVLDRVCAVRAVRRNEEAERSDARARVEKLTPRQLQVLRGMASGDPSKVIAHNLSLSIRTVEAYRALLLERIAARTTAEAVRIAVRAGLMDSPS